LESPWPVWTFPSTCKQNKRKSDSLACLPILFLQKGLAII
jgi:hypothetical protein